jgi:hypothetical protein
MKSCFNPECPEDNPQPLANFHKQSTGKLGVRSRCRTCHNEDMRDRHTPEIRRVKTLSQYVLPNGERMTPGIFDRMVEEQEGKCAICSSTDPKTRHGQWEVDHCHKTNTVRALLCKPCNIGIGMFFDQPVPLLKAAIYLEKYASLTNDL